MILLQIRQGTETPKYLSGNMDGTNTSALAFLHIDLLRSIKQKDIKIDTVVHVIAILFIKMKS